MENGEVTEFAVSGKKLVDAPPIQVRFCFVAKLAKYSTRARRALWHAAMHLHRDHAHAWPKNVA